jgi:predicted NBD/HSP70 family sugar kinase
MRINSIQKVVFALRKGISTKNEIVNETGLSWGSCSSIINLLDNEEIIVKTDNKIGEGRGRKTTKYHFNNTKHLLFGIEIRKDGILCSIINWGKNEIYRHTFPVNETINQSNLAGHVTSAYVHSLVEAGAKSDSIIGMSIALAGSIDIENNKWLYTPRIKSINNYNFNLLFKSLPNISYKFLEHDIHAQASSVIKQRNWDDKEYIFIHIGRGISMSIYNNEVYLGDRGYAGEIGHIPYISSSDENEFYSVESAISITGIINFIEKEFGKKINSLEELPEDLLKKESLRNHVFNAIKFILIVTTNILDPNTIIIGGPVLEQFNPWLKEKIEKEIRSYTWAGGPKHIKWYKNEEMYGAFGTILNASDKIIDAVIKDQLV